MSFNITVEGGKSVKLPTAGKYCDRNIIVTAKRGGSDTSDATATEDDIMLGKTAYLASGKGTGRFTLESEMTEQDALIVAIKTALKGKAAGGGVVGGDPALPAGYVRCGFIQFTGEQYIDTGVLCNETTRIKTFFTNEQDGASYLYAATSTGNTATVSAYIGASTNWRFKDKTISRSISQSEELIHTTIHDSTGVDQITSKGNYSGITSFTTPNTLALGAGHTPSDTYVGTFFIGKIFSFRIWQGETEVLHLSPVVSTDGVYRFYDEVSQSFFDSISDTPLEGGNL